MDDLMLRFRAALRGGPFSLGGGDPDLRFRPVRRCPIVGRQGPEVRALVARVAAGRLRTGLSCEAVPGGLVLHLWENAGPGQFTVRTVEVSAGKASAPIAPAEPLAESAWEWAARVTAGVTALLAFGAALVFELPWWLVAVNAALLIALLAWGRNPPPATSRNVDAPRRPDFREGRTLPLGSQPKRS